MRILLVEDGEEVSRTIARFLSARGHQLRVASDGCAALEQMEQWSPDVVLCDFQMPRMDGIEVLKAARQRWPAIPVMLMTADREIDTAIAAFRDGAYDFLKKPIKLEELLACLSRIEKGSQPEG